MATKKSPAAAPRTRKPKAQAAKPVHAHTLGEDDFEFELPSEKRIIAATALTFSLSFTAGYMIGIVTDVIATAALMLTGSVFIWFVIWMLALIGSIYAGMKIGQHVGYYVLSGQIDKDIASVKNKVTGLFGSVKAKFAAA